jgi:hypothetical protein
MHKDKPPGIFDFAERSMRYLICFWLTAGLLLSFFVHTTLLIWRVDAQKGPQPENSLETATAPVTKPTSPPTAPAVRY